MSKETSGVGQGALPPKDDPGLRAQVVERPAGSTMKIGQVVSGQYIFNPQSPGMTLKQVTPGTASGNSNLSQRSVTRIISISPSRTGQTSPLRPSLANQSIVNALTQPRTNSNIRLQLFTPPNDGTSSNTQSPSTRPVKRPSSAASTEKKDAYASKLQRVVNHRIVRSKLVKEKYNEHLMETFYLENDNNILDLYQFAKRPKTQVYQAYLNEHAIDPNDIEEESPTVTVPMTTPSTPSATPLNSLPGISGSHNSQSNSTTPATDNNYTSTPKSAPKVKTPVQTSNNQEMIVEKAKQEAYVVQRITDLQKDGVWSERRLPKVQEMPRTKAHWDFLLEEMVWLAADFAQERKWKKAAAKKCARMVQKYFQDKALTVQKAEKAQEQHIRRIAAFCAKEIKSFWNSVEKLVEYKQNTILEEKRKKALDQQLSFIVDQTEKYSQLLAEGMNKTADQTQSVVSSSRAVSDDEFDPEMQSEEDDEETIDQEEAAVGNDGHAEEVEALQKESQMELDDLLNDNFLRDYLLNRDNIKLSGSEDSGDDEETVEHDKKSKSSEDSESVKEDEDKESSEEVEENENDEETKTGEDEGLKMLLDDTLKEGERQTEDKKDDYLNDAAAIAESIQPKGNTLSSTSVSTNIPFLLKFPLREYQHIGLDWLVTMFERKLNGILADEMGLGKTIQTIALLAHLACEKGNWGPHLIIVPTSVMLNWEMECKKWCPAFKILTYYGTQKERKFKRIGWTKPNAFHICITSYKLVVQDHQSFRRKKWKYLILDEAQNIKNFKSQRWQLLLNFQTHQRLLLTGTPLQNNLMELWSLMHFLMPNVFQSHREFKEWFSNPVTGMIEGNSEYNENIIKRLHKVLRPFLLRRLKSEVEKQMPKKYEHVVMCRLSKRQRYLYDDYMSRAKTRETLASGNLLSVINVLMQLRKVCNHPNLFEVRPTISPFQCDGLRLHIPSIVYTALDYDPFKHMDLYSMNLLLIMQEIHLSSYQCYRMGQLKSVKMCNFLEHGESKPNCPPSKLAMRVIADKSAAPIKSEKSEQGLIKLPPQTQFKTFPAQNVKIKVSSVRFFSQQALLKSIPVMNISQASTGQLTSEGIVTADRIATNFAQLVQTSTGKHLLLTSNPSTASGNIPVTDSQGGQKLTFLSNQPVSTFGNAPQQLTKAFVKFQLGSVASTSSANATTTNLSTTSSTSTAGGGTTTTKADEKSSTARLQIGNDYVSRLYSNQNNLDVRWQNKDEHLESLTEDDPKDEKKRRLELMIKVNKRRCSALPLYGRDFQDGVKIFSPNKKDTWAGGGVTCLNTLFRKDEENNTKILASMLYNPEKRLEQLKDICDRFIFYVPAVKTPEPDLQVWHPPPSKYWGLQEDRRIIQRLFSKPATPLHHIASAMVTQFPDPRLIQYDCGKLQTLDRLLRRLKTDGHRVLIFTQMSKMLNVLEAFLNYHGYIYLRLDGTTKVDQRQVLMERFNGDNRIFAFILSTRSGGVGVNLTGADTVIFYDSDWNPTMDAQAQDRCHRIGQTKDVHIYRLISEKTIEENILKKANQKRLLGDLAIEGGNFTTAYFKSSTIQDLFNIDSTEDSAANRLSGPVEVKREIEKSTNNESNVIVGDEKTAVSALENALAECEDDQDVQAAKIAKAEAVADLAEFDENIPLEEQDKDREPEVSRAEQEINNIINKLSPIEKYAMKFIETTESAWSAEQLAAAEREIENQKREWEQNRLAALKEEEERRHRELEEESELLTFSREDAANQIWVSDNTMEKMPMWCPPTPPQQENDVYIDQTLSFLYDTQNVMSETDLPPVYTKREAKRNRIEAELIDSRRAMKLSRKEDSSTAPKSLFHSAQILKMRRDLKLQKYRSFVRPSISIPGKSSVQKPQVEQTPLHEWTIHEDIALLKVIQNYLGLPMNLMAMKPGHTPNWDFVSDYVNTVSITYRSPKQCRQRYETHLIQREEDKRLGIDSSFKKKKNKIGKIQKLTLPSKTRSLRNSQLYLQDNNSAFAQIMSDRFESLKNTANKRVPAARIIINNPLMNKTKNTPVLNECGIDLEHPVLPVEVAARRAERIAKEKRNLTQDQQIAAAKLQLIKGYMSNQQHSAASASTSVPSPSVSAIGTSTTQVVLSASTAPVSTITSISLPGTPTNTLRPQRVTASPVQTSSVVSVSGLSPAQLQAATQRLIVSASASGQAKAVAASTSGMQGKSISPAQLAMIRQANIKQQLRLHASSLSAQGVKTSTVTIGGQQAVVQFTQAQQRAQFVRQGTVTVSGKAGLTRTVTESEVAQLLKKQHQLQQQKLASGGGSGTIQNISQQVLAQAIQASASGSQVGTLVKAVSASEANQTVTIPVTGVTLTSQGKMITSAMKPTNAAQLRQLQLQQQQILAQKKLAGQKLSFAQVGGKGNMPTQLIVSPKQVPTAMTVQQFQQVIRSPLNVSHTPVVLAKVPPRVIPVNTPQGTKQTVQVVATSQALSSALTVPRGSTTLTGALAGFKNQTLITAALNQNVAMRQSSPVRIQTSSAAPLVAVTVQNVQQQQQQTGLSQQTSNTDQE